MADDIGRMFLCVRCRVQVVLCRRCDRGQFYCGQMCSRAARIERQRDAGRRYQCSIAGQAKHAERSRRWRSRQREQGVFCPEDTGPVTHQGPPHGLSEAQYVSRNAADSTGAVTTRPDNQSQAQRFCPQCMCALQPWVRQGFLRRRRTAATGARLARASPSPPACSAATYCN